MHRNNGTQDDSVRLSLGAALTRHLSPSLILCNIRKRRSDAGTATAGVELFSHPIIVQPLCLS